MIAQTWTNYTNDRLIADILVDGNDVWVGSQGGLTRTDLQTGEFQTYLPGNSPIVGGGISEIAKGPDGSLWFGSENAGVFHVKNGEWIHYYDGIVADNYDEINNLQVISNGDAWFMARLGGHQTKHRLFRIRNGILESFDNLPDNQRAFYVANESTIFFVSSDQLHRYDIVSQQVTHTFHPGNSVIGTTEKLSDILADKHGKLIIPTDYRILQLQDDQLSVLSTTGLYANRSFTDNEGNIYFQPYHNEPNQIRLVKYDGVELTYYKDEDFTPYPASDHPLFNAADSEYGLFAMIFNVDSEFILFRVPGIR
jgi:ligand-binding sensor domain-containing protein